MPQAIIKTELDAFRALIGAGFTLTDRGEGAYRIVCLKKGRLKISMGMTRERLDQVAPESTPASGAA